MIRISRTGIFTIIFLGAILPLLYLFMHQDRSHMGQASSVVLMGTKGSPQPQENKVKACFVILIRNKELQDWRKSMRQLEDRFNRNHNYPYVFLNDVPFTDEFMKNVQALTQAKVEFGLIPKEHWSYPDYIDQDKARQGREQMERDNIIYGGSESYRHMCRFESGFFFRHNLTLKYDYYWRVEPGVSFACDIDEDPFLYMHQNDKKYGFTISLHEYESTIPTLWATVNSWLDDRKLRPKLPKDNAMDFISGDKGKTYNLCHFWSNFEIASFDLWRDQQYLDFFDYLDHAGGFFYERWGDAPVHSIYASLMLPREKIHFFNTIGYTHPPYSHCPIEKNLNLKCHCDPKDNFDYDGYSCTAQWFDLVGHK
ncbi:hypothetical protein DSO57_1020733 [Entomophthora muscae]|uniref:Uncharacterized protein n=1 Tax=Entomophthora muscae TaxID=34485 RepID=A0ACC2UPT4_9FUNG|nr:hypothetical protein DSO57_1020733 [Entomophthora muscae]